MRWTIVVVLCGLSTLASTATLVTSVRTSYAIATLSSQFVELHNRHEQELVALSDKIKQLQSDLALERMRTTAPADPGF